MMGIMQDNKYLSNAYYVTCGFLLLKQLATINNNTYNTVMLWLRDCYNISIFQIDF